MFSVQRHLLNKVSKPISISLVQRLSGEVKSGDGQPTNTPPPPPPPQSSGSEVSSDNTSYKVKEYYGYNPYSFYDIDKDMSKFRNPQPSKYSPLQPPKQ